MKPAFLEKYISSLTAASDELLLDSTRLTTLHASILGHAGGHNKKDTGIKRAMLASLVSQIVAWQSMNARTSLLQSMSEVHDAGLLKGVIPVWSGLVIDESDETRWLASHPAREQDGFIRVLGKTLDKGTGTALVNVEGESWRYFLGLMSSGPASRALPLFRSSMTS
jgi:U3 small nucleolar RNA-associated protein 10